MQYINSLQKHLAYKIKLAYNKADINYSIIYNLNFISTNNQMIIQWITTWRSAHKISEDIQ